MKTYAEDDKWGIAYVMWVLPLLQHDGAWGREGDSRLRPEDKMSQLDPSMPCEDCEQGLSSCCPDYSYAGMIAPYIEAALKLDQDMIETACEKSIQGGKHGVLVLRSGVAGPVVSAEVDESVPYGKIYERALE